VIAGCNFPPSQFQLHIQYFLPPFLPFQYRMYLEGQHLTHERFFPLEYITAVLALNDPVSGRLGSSHIGRGSGVHGSFEVHISHAQMEVDMNTDMHAIIKRFNDRVDYNAMHAACYERAGVSHQHLANWQERQRLCIV